MKGGKGIRFHLVRELGGKKNGIKNNKKTIKKFKPIFPKSSETWVEKSHIFGE